MNFFKESEFGNIPRDWELLKIDDLKSREKYSISMGPFGSNITTDNFVSDGIPIIRGGNLNHYKFQDNDFVYVSETKAEELKSSTCKSGDLVFTHRGTLGQVGIIPNKSRYKKYLISQSGMKLTVDENKIHNYFLFYFFKSPCGQYQLLKNKSQVGVPSISTPLTSLKQIEVPVPSLPEQKSITAILSSLDDKIELLQEQNETLESIAQALFKRWFVDFEFPNEKGKPYKSSGGKMVESEIEKIPEEWVIGRFGDLVEILTGKGINKDEYSANGVIPIYGSNGIIGKTDKFLFNEALILTGRVGTLGEIFRVNGKIWISDNVLIIRCKQSYLYSYIYFAISRLNFNSLNVGSTQPLITQGGIKNLELLIPKEYIIKQFQIITESLFKKVTLNSYQIETLSIVRNTLLPKLMSGEVRVRL